MVLWSGKLCIVWLPTRARPGGGGGRIARQLSVHISWITSIQEMTKGVDEQKRSVVGLLIISRVELRSGKLGIV